MAENKFYLDRSKLHPDTESLIRSLDLTRPDSDLLTIATGGHLQTPKSPSNLEGVVDEGIVSRKGRRDRHGSNPPESVAS